MPVDVADWILAVLESTHPIIFCCWPAEIPGFVFYRAQQTLAPLGKRLKGRHQPSASRQALGDPNWPIREARQQLFCSANVGAIYYPRLTTARLANAGRASA